MPIRMSGLASGLDTDAVIKEMMSAQSLKKTNLEGKKEKLQWTKEKWGEMNTKLYSFYTDKLSPLKLQGSYLTKKAVSSDESKVKTKASTAVAGSYSMSVDKLASAEYVTGADIRDKGYSKSTLLTEAGMTEGQTITIRTGKNLDSVTEITVDAETTIDDLVNTLKEAGLNANFDEKSGRFYIAAKGTGEANKFTVESNAAEGEGLEKLGLGNITQNLAENGVTAGNKNEMAVVSASDAQIRLNGAVINSSTNTVQANGLTLELIGTTNDDGIKLTVSNDTDAVYDKIKDFVKQYNELMTDMYEKYSAPSAKGYSMLTSEQKEAMTDDQVKLWEDKIKGSLLRRDDTLNSLMTAFRTAMQETVEVDGQKFSLSSFGIVTGDYTERGLLHIEGDADDPAYLDKNNKLKSMLESDPELVGKALSKVMDKFYDTLSNKMSATNLSSALTFYNDKQMKTQTEQYEKQIKSWDTKLQDIEDRYYKQFSAMEKAMADLQTKQSQLAGFFG
jgi:flagellar hook-associated protein 2